MLLGEDNEQSVPKYTPLFALIREIFFRRHSVAITSIITYIISLPSNFLQRWFRRI